MNATFFISSTSAKPQCFVDTRLTLFSDYSPIITMLPARYTELLHFSLSKRQVITKKLGLERKNNNFYEKVNDFPEKNNLLYK